VNKGNIQEARMEQEKDNRLMDNAIDIPLSSIPFPCLPLVYSQSSTISFDPGFATNQISPAEREEFQSQQIKRRQQRLHIQVYNLQEGHDIWDLENRLDIWVGKCPLCYVRKCAGSQVDIRHTLEKCIDKEQELVYKEIEALQSI
jgi:hypothetical protein